MEETTNEPILNKTRGKRQRWMTKEILELMEERRGAKSKDAER